jgi:hypothetical protein
MVLYLAASVVGVVVIVYLVIHLTKSGANNPATGSSTPSTGTTAAAGGPGTGFVFTQAAAVGKFPLNKAATNLATPLAVSQSAAVAHAIKANGAGQPGKVTVGVYDLTSVTSITSSAFKGIIFVGYGGTFNPTSVIKLERSILVSSRVVKAGPNGGKMVCGYNATGGSDASECVWVTKTTFGQVEFLQGRLPVKYPGAAKLALAVRKAVEVPAR